MGTDKYPVGSRCYSIGRWTLLYVLQCLQRGFSKISARRSVADNIEGPYVDQGIMLKSGMWGEPSEDGTIYDATIHPNAVDPDVFFDENGKLWMVYGSYSGGIFILELDPVTGKQLPGQGYGKKLMGGNHSRIEGPYILYSPESDYYYMFVSYGGLDAVGGYNIRVARSKNPDGPYVDAEGTDMIQVKANPELPLFDDRSIEPFGVKLMGNYQFTRELGDPGAGTGLGYISPGHNSAYYDEETGKHLLFFHTRFPGRGEEHEIRVHEMYMNDKGWPVVAPYRYTDIQQKEVKKNEAAGSYKIVNHGKDISAELKTSVIATLEKNGKIRGDVEGTWSLDKDGTATLKTDGVTYTGVFTKEWDESSQKKCRNLQRIVRYRSCTLGQPNGGNERQGSRCCGEEGPQSKQYCGNLSKYEFACRRN